MTDPEQRLPYAELEPPTRMRADCRQAVRTLGLSGPGRSERDLERAARAAVQPPPSIRFEDYPREVPKRGIRVSQAARRLAAAIFD